jgi:CheY-like chemotaxis protein
MNKLPAVLLVDDDQTTNYLNRMLLQRLNVADHILVAHDGREALDLLTTYCVPPTPQCPRLLLLDVNMPGMNGIQFLEAYRQLPLAAQKPLVILMLTTSLHPRDVQRVQALDTVAGFVSKPLTAAKMEAIMAEHFQSLP